MAEAIAAIGVGASIIQFISLAEQLIRRINDYSSSVDQVPQALRGIATQLPFLVESCQKLGDDNESASASEIIQGCHQEVEYLYSLMDDMLPAAGDPKIKRAMKAVQSVRYQQRIEFSLRKLESFKTGLILYCCQRESFSGDGFHGASFPHNLPPPPTSLSIPRNDLLSKISQRFDEYDRAYSGHRIVILVGMGGQGKSRLALDFGRRRLNDNDGKLVLWMDATSMRTLTRSFEDVADRWNNRKRGFLDTDTRIAFVKARLDERSSLLILDNYDYPDRFPDVCRFVPSSCGSVLITSRNANAGTLGKVVWIEGIEECSGLELLLHRTQHDINDGKIRGDAIKILHALGDLPLAIDQAGAYIRDRKIPLQEFVENYRSRKEEVLNQRHIYWDYKKRLHEEEVDETPLGVLTTWEMSIREVNHTRICQSAIERLMTLTAFLSHTEVSEKLFRGYAERIHPVPDWLQYFVSDGKWNHGVFREVVADLSKLSLAYIRNRDPDECCLSLHPMIKDWLQLRITESDRFDHVVETVKILADSINSNSQGRTLQEARSLLEHLDACIDSYKALQSNPHSYDFGGLRDHETSIFSFYMSHGRYREAEEGFESLLKRDIAQFGESHASTVQTMRYLADAHVHSGRYAKAQEVLSVGLEKWRLREGMENPETFYILCGLADVYAKTDCPTDAESYYESAVRVHSGQKQDVHRQKILPVYERLAEVKRYLGKHNEAENLYVMAYRGYEQKGAYDEDSNVDILRTAGGLADLLRTQGRYKEAERCYREAWQGYEKEYGPDHPKTLAMLTSLAISCRNQGNYREAETYLEQAVPLLRQTLGSDHPETLRALMNLGICIDRQGHYRLAEAKYWEVLKGREAKLGLSHPYTLRTVERLAHMLWMQGQHAAAETFALRMLVKRGELPKPSPFDSADRDSYMALKLLYTLALERMKRKIFNNHVDALETCECLRLVYIKLGEHAKVDNLLQWISSKRNTDSQCSLLSAAEVNRVQSCPLTEAKERGEVSQEINRSRRKFETQGLPYHQDILPATLLLLCVLIGLLAWLTWYYWTAESEGSLDIF